MLNLDNYPEFKSDIQGKTFNLHPVVVIKSDPDIYLSQNEEVMNVGGVQTQFRALDLKVPSIKESLDLESKKIKINNVSISLSNYGYAHDMFFSQSLINKYVEIYWKSQSCRDIEDCLLVYKAVIKRINHDKKYIKLELEDFTESAMHKEVPISIVEPENAYNDKYVHKTIPMSYGVVDKAPAVLWTSDTYNVDGESSIQYIFALTDRFDLTRMGASNQYSGHNLASSSTSSTRSPISIFTGNYLWINEIYNRHTNAYTYSSTRQYSTFENKVRLQKYYTGETPKNSIAEDIAQVVVNRSAISASLLDSNDVEGFEYQGLTEGAFIEQKELLLTKYDINEYGDAAQSIWNTHATIPSRIVDSFEEPEEQEGGWVNLDTFKNHESPNITDAPLYKLSVYGLGNNNNLFKPFSDRYNTSNYGYGFDSDLNTDLTYNTVLAQILHTIDSRNCEVISMPNSQKLWSYYLQWYINNVAFVDAGATFADVHPWESGLHKWGGHLRYDNKIAYPYFRIAMIDGTFNYILFSETRVEEFDGTITNGSLGDVSDLYDFTMPSWIPDALATEEIYSDAVMEDENPLDSPYNVQFWTLLEEIAGRFYGQVDEGLDVPRYRINGIDAENLETIVEDNIVHNCAFSNCDDSMSIHRSYYQQSYNAEWNSVPQNIWENASNYNGDTSLGHDSHGTFSLHMSPYIRPALRSGFNNFRRIIYDEDLNFNQIYSNEKNWFLHFKKYGDYVGDAIIPEGLLIPAQTYFLNPTINTQYADFSPRYPDTFFSNDTAVMQIGNYDGTQFVNIKDGSSIVTDKRVGIVYSLEDAGVEDAMEGTGVTTFWGKFSFTPSSEHVTPTGFKSLKVNFLEADLEEDNLDTLESDGVGVLKSEQLSLLNANDNERTIDSLSNYPTTVKSFDWANPNDFNAGILRFWADNFSVEYDTDANCPINIKLHHLGVKHVLDIEKIFDKDFYVSSNGRASGNNPLQIIKDIIETELEVEPFLHESYTSNISNANNWDLAFSITEKVNSKILIENIAKSTPFIPYFKSTVEGSSLAFTYIKDEYSISDVDKVISQQDVIRFQYDRTKIENAKTMCRIKFKKDYARDNFAMVTGYRDAYDFFGNGDIEGNPLYYSKEHLGYDPLTPGDSVLDIENEFIRDLSVANRLRDFLVAYHCNQHTIIKCKLPLTYIDLEIADIVKFDSIIQGQKAYGEVYTTPANYYIRNGQGIYPYFIVTSVNKSIDSVSIECVQLHKLTPEYSITSTGSGDILRKGSDATIEDHTLLNNYLSGYEKYFTVGQKQNADISSDGLINYTDLSLLAEQVGIVQEEEEEEEIIEETITTITFANFVGLASTHAANMAITNEVFFSHQDWDDYHPINEDPYFLETQTAIGGAWYNNVYIGHIPSNVYRRWYSVGDGSQAGTIVRGGSGYYYPYVNVMHDNFYSILNTNPDVYPSNLHDWDACDGWHLKVGTEWMKIVRYHNIYANRSYMCVWTVIRGLFTDPSGSTYDPNATAPYAHSGTEEIRIYSDEPIIVHDVVTGE